MVSCIFFLLQDNALLTFEGDQKQGKAEVFEKHKVK